MARLAQADIVWPFFIVLGAVLSALPTRFRMLGKAAFYFGFIFFSLDLVSFYPQTAGPEPRVYRSAEPIEHTADGNGCGDVGHGNRSIEQYYNGPLYSFGATESHAGNGGDSDCDWVKHWDDGDCSGRQPQDEKDGTTRGRGQPLLQYLWRPAVPTVSRTVRDNRGGPGG